MLTACGAPKDATPPPPAGPTLADFAGTWENTSTLTGVAAPVTSTMTGTADTTGWTMTLQGRAGIPLHVSVVGDSLIAQSAEYESILRKGVMVTTRTAAVLKDGMLVGTLMADYKTAKGVEKVAGTYEGKRAAK
jgi:hypothetical protein